MGDRISNPGRMARHCKCRTISVSGPSATARRTRTDPALPPLLQRIAGVLDCSEASPTKISQKKAKIGEV